MTVAHEQMPGSMEWTVRPVEKRPLAGLCAVLVIIVFGVLVALFAGDWIWGVLAVVVLFATVSRFFLPSRIQVSTEGILAEFPLVTRRVSWNQVTWIRHDDQSALIRTTRKRFRGREFTILFDQSRDRAIGLLHELGPSGLVSKVSSEESDS